MKVVATIVLLALAFSAPLFVEDGLVVHFTIKKILNSETSTYTNGVLMRKTESSTLTFPGQYEMRLEAKAVEGDRENLVVALKDITGAKPFYAGSGATTIKIGESQTLAFHELKEAKTRYEIFLDTAYGKLSSPARP